MTSKTCMSWLNIKNKNSRCTRKTCENSDFCHYHKRSAIYMPQLNNIPSAETLDQSCPETLLGIYDSWTEVPTQYWIKINDKWWDVRILTDLFSNQLCSSEMENPKPTYPNDPFNRRNFTPDELLLIKNKCIELKLKIYIGLYYFLSHEFSGVYKQEYGTTHSMCISIVNILSHNLRYKIINNKNSQECFTGVWIQKNAPMSKFEQVYNLYNSLPFQVVMVGAGGVMLTDNINKINVKFILDNFDKDNVDLHDDSLTAILS